MDLASKRISQINGKSWFNTLLKRRPASYNASYSKISSISTINRQTRNKWNNFWQFLATLDVYPQKATFLPRVGWWIWKIARWKLCAPKHTDWSQRTTQIFQIVHNKHQISRTNIIFFEGRSQWMKGNFYRRKYENREMSIDPRAWPQPEKDDILWYLLGDTVVYTINHKRTMNRPPEWVAEQISQIHKCY